MYKLGFVACLFVVVLVGGSGCLLHLRDCSNRGQCQRYLSTYIAGENTPAAETFVITPTPTPPTAAVNISGVQTNVTPTQVTINCNGQSCSGFVNVTRVILMPR